MIILGIAGPIGHGKTTLADFFAQIEPNSVHLESGQIIAEVANALNAYYADCNPQPNDIVSANVWLSHLPQIIEDVTHYRMTDVPVLTDAQQQSQPEGLAKLWSYLQACQADPSLTSQPISNQNKSHYRSILQWLGAFGEQHIKNGLWYGELTRRAKQSNKRLAVIGGVRFKSDAQVIQQEGGNVIEIIRPGFNQPDLNDPTEKERSDIPTNSTVVNNGSLTQLYATSKQILIDIQANNLASQYETNKL